MTRRASILSLVPLLVALWACGYDNDGEVVVIDGDGVAQPSDDIAVSTIDTGALFSGIEPGQGVGVFLEYETDGVWQLSATCDSLVSGFGCVWDVIVTPVGQGTIFDAEIIELDEDDWLGRDGDASLRLVTYTTDELDAIQFQAIPGQVLRVDVFLDDASESRFIYWIGDGAVHRGAPTNPIDLQPSEP
jgi:hypothetical protein